jgi:hypothetical protein
VTVWQPAAKPKSKLHNRKRLSLRCNVDECLK